LVNESNFIIFVNTKTSFKIFLMSKIIQLKLKMFIFFLIFSGLNLSGQQHKCGADELHEKLSQNPEYLNNYLRNYKEVHKSIGKGDRVPCATPLVIPLAFHFNDGVTSANMSCIMAQIQRQIDALNEDFGGYNADIENYCALSSACPTQFPPNALGNNACIQFCLATQNLPAGETDAITFGQYRFQTGAPAWNGYFNVFVSNMNPPDDDGIVNPNLLGIAPLGGASNPNGNGMFITSSAFGGDAVSCISGVPLNSFSQVNLGRTGTHEAGHYFGLNHVFDGCNNGDGIADTPGQSASNTGNPTVNLTTCISNAKDSCNGVQPFFFNYMDYVNDAAMFMFTKNQNEVMKGFANLGSSAGVNSWKTNTITCTGLNNPTYPPSGCPTAAPPNSVFTQSYNGGALCAALASIQFTDASTGFPSSWLWTFSGAGVSPPTSTLQNPIITFASTGTVTATLTASNGSGSDLTPATQMINVMIADPATCGNCSQNVYDPGGASLNYPANQDATYTYCSNSPNEILQIDFSSINLEPLPSTFSSFTELFSTTDHIKIYNGPIATGTPANYVFQNRIYSINGSLLQTTPNNTFISTEQCVTFVFDNSGGSFPGWAALITCVTKPTCADGIQNQGETFVDCGGPCSPCNLCNNFQFTDVGGVNNNAGVSTQSWTICADLPTEHVLLDFSTINMTPTNNGILRVYEGTSTSVPQAYYISGNQIFTLSGSSLVPTGLTSIASAGQCFSFRYTNGSNTSGGWVANVNCCVNGACPSATNAGLPFNATLETVCPGNLNFISNFRPEGGSGTRLCSTPSLEFKTYYAVKCDANGGLLSVDVSANSNGGNVQAGLYGPVTGGCPNYAGGTYVDCEDGLNPAELTRQALPNETYIVVITSENAGTFNVASTSNSTALPVNLLKFEAIKKGKNVLLTWTTLAEINNEGFSIMRSIDGKNFELIDFVKGMGNSTKENNYSYTDENLDDGQYYYKLAQKDLDGAINHSKIITISINGIENQIKVYPNPSKDMITVEGSGLLENVKLINALNQVVYTKLSILAENKIDIQVDNLPRGIYTLKAENNKVQFVKSVIIID
jgi:PKD repeat protein